MVLTPASGGTARLRGHETWERLYRAGAQRHACRTPLGPRIRF